MKIPLFICFNIYFYIKSILCCKAKNGNKTSIVHLQKIILTMFNHDFYFCRNGGQSLVIEIQRASQLSFLNQSLWQPEPTMLIDPTDMRRCSHDKGYTSESDLSDTDEGIYSWPSNNTSTPVKKDKKSEV